MWIIQNFRDIFNQILELDPKSNNFKQIEHMVRIVSQLPHEKLSASEIHAVENAQIYLLKLISVRQLPASSSLDPNFS